MLTSPQNGKRNIVIKVVLVATVLTTIIIFVRQTGWLEGVSTESLREFVYGYGVWAPLVFILVYAVATVAVVPGSALTLTSGALFGPLLGTVCAVIGASIGATLSFLFVRLVRGGKPLSGEGALLSRLARYDERMASRGFITVLFLRLVPLFPFTALNYSLGLSRVTTRDYILGTVIGIIPGSFAYTYFGDALAMLMVTEIILAALIIIGLTFGGRYLAKRYG